MQINYKYTYMMKYKMVLIFKWRLIYSIEINK